MTDYIYRFTNTTKEKLISFSNSELWFSKLSSFNDPFEGEVEVNDVDYSKEELITAYKKYNKLKLSYVLQHYGFFRRLLYFTIYQFRKRTNTNISVKKSLKLISKLQKQLIIEIQSVKKKIGVCCFIGGNDEEVLLNNLMWSHYGDGLKGFCYKFEKDLLTNSINNNFDFMLGSANVTYLNKVPQRSSIDYYNSLNDNEYFVPITQSLGPRFHLYTLLSTKSEHWEYESEWRILGSKTGGIKYSPKALKEIIIGEKMNPEIQNQVITTAKKLNPEIIIKYARVKKGTYNIEIVDEL